MASEQTTLNNYLHRVLNRWRLMLILRGISALAIAGVVLFLLCVAIVHTFDPVRVVNIIILSIAAVALGYIAFRYLVNPLRRTPTDLQVARYIEERHPGLNDAFVSAVEYGDAPLREPQKALLDQLMEHVAEFSEQIDFKKVVDRKRHFRLQAAAALATVILAVLVIQDPGYFGRSALRLVTWNHAGPVSPGEIRVEPGNARVRRGDSQTISASLGNGFSQDPKLFIRFGQDDDWSTQDLYAMDRERNFTTQIRDIERDGRYYVAVADERSREFKLTVFDPPYVERIDVRYDFPAYTGLAAKIEEDRGDITAPVSTKVTLSVTVSKAVKSAELRFSDGLSMDLDVEGDDLDGSFVVQEDLSYTIHLRDVDDAENDEPVEYYVRALPDRAPHVTILEPIRDSRVSPVDEVKIRAEAVDDFGLATFSLNYAVNGGEEQVVDLGALQDESSGTVWEGEYMVYLENLSVQPGDFVAYYAVAGDRRGDAGTMATDMFFIEVKPFDETYRQGEGGGGGGGGGGEEVLQTRQLSRKQKEIISATWRVKRSLAVEPEAQTEKDLESIAAVQDDLRSQTDDALAFMRFQVGFSRDAMKPVETLENALEPMTDASDALRSGLVDDALVHERTALMYLTRLDAQMRDYTVNRARGRAGRAPLDMSDTSELELEDDRNRYERPDQPALDRQRERSIDENQQRIQDLARRQQQLNDRMRQLEDGEEQPEAGRRRELDRLTRLQRELREDTEEVARSLTRSSDGGSRAQNPQPGSQGPPLDQASRELRESSEAMGESVEQLRRNSLQRAGEGGSRAEQRLTDASRQLQRAQGESLERLAREAVRQADQLATRQEQLARTVDELKEEKDGGFEGIRNRLDAIEAGRGGLSEEGTERRLDRFVRERLREVEEAKEEIRSGLERLKEDLDFLSRRSSQAQPETAQATDQARDIISDENLNERIERSKRLLKRNTLDSAARTEEEIAEALNRLSDQVRSARDKLISRDMDHLARAQESTRDAMSEWQDLQRQLYRLNRGIPNPESLDRISRDYQRQMQRLEELSGQAPRMSGETRQLQDDLDRARGLGNEPWKIDRGEWNELHRNLARSLRDYYDGLRAEVREMRRRERLYMAREEEVPPGYRDLVNEYYENLSKNRDRN